MKTYTVIGARSTDGDDFLVTAVILGQAVIVDDQTYAEAFGEWTRWAGFYSANSPEEAEAMARAEIAAEELDGAA